MEDARGRAAATGDLKRLAQLYEPTYAYLREGNVRRLWEDTLLGDKDTIPDFTSWRNRQSARLVPRGTRRVLEIGVGVGHAIPFLYARHPAIEYYGIDTSEKIVERLTGTHRETFVVASIENLPWKDLAFDAILMLEVLEHIEVPRTFSVLSALRHRLSERGVLILSVPLREDLRRSYFICAHCGKPLHQIGHLRSYSPELLRAELELSGYIVEKCLPLAGGKYFGIRRQYLMPFFPKKVQPMVLVVRCRAAGGTS